MLIGRRVGWFLSKKFLYQSAMSVCIILSFLWGILIAYLIHYLIQWQHPGLVLKIIMGFALGGYVAIPNYGLIAESTIPHSEKLRHKLIGGIPAVTYILATIIFALT